MRVAYPAISALQLPFYLAEDAGLFQRYGLDVELLYIQAAPNVARSLMAGDVAIAGRGLACCSRPRRRARISS